MTHKDIYTKFMIEYDKANVTSSYPSLTEYEVATVLDKAYNALIAQKVTGNNVRRVGLEGDLKAVTDIAPLIKDELIDATNIPDTNILQSQLPNDYLYFITANMMWPNIVTSEEEIEDADTEPHMVTVEDAKAADGIKYRKMPIKLVSHDMANNFIATSYNIPWIKIPVCYIENNNIFTVYDSFKTPDTSKKIDITYIKTPNKFVKTLDDASIVTSQSYFNYVLKDFEENIDTEAHDDVSAFTETNEAREVRRAAYNTAVSEIVNKYNFECNNTVAEELISLAVAFALENVESQRLNTKLNMRGLEA